MFLELNMSLKLDLYVLVVEHGANVGHNVGHILVVGLGNEVRNLLSTEIFPPHQMLLVSFYIF